MLSPGASSSIQSLSSFNRFIYIRVFSSAGNKDIYEGINAEIPLKQQHQYEPPLKPSDKHVSHHKKRRFRWSPRWHFHIPKQETSTDNSLGYEVPTHFKIAELNRQEQEILNGVETSSSDGIHLNRPHMPWRNTHDRYSYTDFVGNRFPSLDTATNFRYWKDTGLDRLLPRVFPLKIPCHRKLDPLLREYLLFLSELDPARFTISNLALRYSLSENTVKLAIRDASLKIWLETSKLCQVKNRRISQKEAILEMKEYMYSLKKGYSQLGDEEEEPEVESEFKGWKNTVDWVYSQSINVESMSAFPLPKRSNPVKKKVDYDLVCSNTADYKVMNWVDPKDKVVF